MRQYTSENLVIRPNPSLDHNLIIEVTPELAGWEHIHFQSRKLTAGAQGSFETGKYELVLVVLGGTVDIHSNRGQWQGLGERPNVFCGLPYALYLPPQTAFSVQAASDCEFALAWAATDQAYPAHLITPAEITVEIRGGDHATRQINQILPPGFPCARLVVVEVYTPGGNWSSYPPHKHDVHKTDPAGNLLEADLEEVYYYKFTPPEGFALQRIYTAAESPLHRAGYPIEATVLAQHNHAVLVPEGYHPVSSPVGYTTYYLNVLAGSAPSLAATDDPQYAWIKDTYQTCDPRLPLYDVSGAKALV